ncbi:MULTISPECIES: alpha-xenorhabdolysin family binary toxin subunit A [Pseudomonas]|uniref:Uncharacterized protein n=1 Tax=Pseudomonas kribbensis TaxID=1628086 RepID=A0A4Y8VRH8_9PSED|nr:MULTISPECIES: alpha-xenorhabdolysin family binary toxin subunit A [Pseudomonas]TFH83202.1 hypothetical protein E4J90_03500 [Pseudomonas kribbensis]
MEFHNYNKSLEVASKVPLMFVDASLGRGVFEGEEAARETGIQLTKEQIISIMKYEALGLSLPVQLQDVIAYLNYGAGDDGGVGLKAEDFLRTFVTTYEHAQTWSPLRDRIKLTGEQLKIFAGTIQSIGGNILAVYNGHPAAAYLDAHNISSIEEFLKFKAQFPDIPDIELPPDDIPDIKYYLEQLLGRVKKSHGDAEQVKAELKIFGDTLHGKVVPEIKLRLSFIEKNTYQQDIKLLQAEIDERAARIDELNAEYGELVKKAVLAGATLNLGGLILGIYYGVNAEKIRKQRNELRVEQAAANQRMASKSQTLSSLNRVRDDFQNLSYVAIEADLATENLRLVWSALKEYIDESFLFISDVVEATSLRRFIGNLRSVISPWEKIQVSSDELIKVFMEAEREYSGSRLVFLNGIEMTMQAQILESDFDMSRLREYDAVVQNSNTHAQMLFQKYNFLQEPVVSMNALARAISNSLLPVRENAQSSRIGLDSSHRRLQSLKLDLHDPRYEDEYEDICFDIEKELGGASQKLSSLTEETSTLRNGFNQRFDRTLAKQWLVAQQKDLAFAEEQKGSADERVSVLKEQMKSIREAINAIEEAGVEKIGEEAQLTLEKLKALGLAPPQIQIAMLALETLKKLVEGIGHAISYLNMLAAYKTLEARAADYKRQADGYAIDVEIAKGKIDLISTLEALDDGRLDFVNEFNKLLADTEKFNREFKQDKTQPVEDRLDVAITRIVEIVDYLNLIQR